MARDMREQFIKASRLHFQAHVEKHRINVENLLENAVGVGEHGDVMETIEQELLLMDKYESLLGLINKYFDDDSSHSSQSKNLLLEVD